MTTSRTGLGHTQAVVMMVMATLMWSIAGVVARQIEGAVRFEVTFWRSAFTVLSLVLILPIWRRRGGAPVSVEPENERSAVGRSLHHHWGLLPESKAFWISGACWSVMFTAFMLAMTFTSVANVLIIMALGPLMTALIARVTLGQRLPPRTWIAIVAAGVGIVYMYGIQFVAAFADPAIDTASLAAGSAIALGVPSAAAVNWTVVQRSQAHGHQIDLVPSVLLGAVLSSLYTLPFALPFAATSKDLAWLGMLGLFQLAIPCMLSVVSARVLKAPEVSLLALLEVIFGILLAWLGAGEEPAREVLTGGTLVIVALCVNEVLGWRERRATPHLRTLQAVDPGRVSD